MNIIDSHCHLDLPEFDEDRSAVLAAAKAAGVNTIINPSTDLPSSRRVLALAQSQSEVYAAIGFHPYDAPDLDEDALVALRALAADENVVAIGEIGLDYYRDWAPKPDQHRAFEQQLELARELDLPVIIHQRDAAPDTMAILRRWAALGEHPGLVLHAFSGDVAMAEEAVALGFDVGIGGPITFKNPRQLPAVVATVPLEHILLETDAPYLSPHPYRGKRNEPARLTLVAEKLAEYYACSADELTQQTTANTRRLFRLTNPAAETEA